jgi:hypothetical protein
VHLSLEALRRLGLDEVWWLVAPQNPLKPAADMAPERRRVTAARALVRHPRIRVLELENRLGTEFTVDTLNALKSRFRRTKFVWLMGADNLSQIRHWRRWPAIFATAYVLSNGLGRVACSSFRPPPLAGHCRAAPRRYRTAGLDLPVVDPRPAFRHPNPPTHPR